MGGAGEAWAALGTIVLTVWLVREGHIAVLIESVSDYGALAAFLPGLLYSTFATTPIAVGGFLEMTTLAPTWQIALLGAAGATLADIGMIHGLRSPLMSELMRAVLGPDFMVHLKRFASGRVSQYAAMTIAWFLIAIPVPTDEVAMTLLGRSKLQGWRLVPFFYIADFVGVFVLLSFVEVFAH